MNSNCVRVATVLFADLVESVVWQRRLGTENGYRSLQETCEGLLRRSIELVGSEFGTIREQDREGDLFVVEFVAPAHAVQTALAFQWLLSKESWAKHFGKEWRSTFEQPRQIPSYRMGIAQGSYTIVDPKKPDHDLSMAKNIASRLQAISLPGQILMSGDVRQQALHFRGENFPNPNGLDNAPACVWRGYGLFQLKGLEPDQPVDVVEVGYPEIAPLEPPPDSEKGSNIHTAWRPKPGQPILAREEYTLEKQIGEGGFGEVWLACRGEPGGPGIRRVFKFCFEPDRLRSFRREGLFANLFDQRLNNRGNILQIYETNPFKPPFYIESAYIEGGNLHDWSRHIGGLEKVSWEERLRLFVEVAEAVETVHSIGVIHKDIKPSNILIDCKRSGSRPHAVLADFGIGCLSNQDILDGLNLPQPSLGMLANETGSRTFTRLYAAPEYVRGGKPSKVGDIYALGIVLYQLWTGDLELGLSTKWEHRVGDPALRELIGETLEDDPDKRIQDVETLLSKIANLPRRNIELRRRTMVRRIGMGMAAVCCLLLTAAVIMLYQYVNSPRYIELKNFADALTRGEQGDVTAMMQVAETYATGLDSGPDFPWYLSRVFTLLTNSPTQIPSDFREALKWFEKAADAGNATAMAKAASIYYAGVGNVARNRRKAFHLYLRAAESGNHHGMLRVGIFYSSGEWPAEQNYQKAAEWFQKAAELGENAAMHNIGMFHLEGKGVSLSVDKGMTWLHKAALNNDITALRKLIWLYSQGEMGVQKDPVKAYEYALQASEQGDALSMLKLAAFLKAGIGVEPNEEKARYWVDFAQNLMNPDVGFRRFNEAEVDEVNEDGEEWDEEEEIIEPEEPGSFPLVITMREAIHITEIIPLNGPTPTIEAPGLAEVNVPSKITVPLTSVTDNRPPRPGLEAKVLDVPVRFESVATKSTEDASDEETVRDNCPPAMELMGHFADVPGRTRIEEDFLGSVAGAYIQSDGKMLSRPPDETWLRFPVYEDDLTPYATIEDLDIFFLNHPYMIRSVGEIDPISDRLMRITRYFTMEEGDDEKILQQVVFMYNDIGDRIEERMRWHYSKATIRLIFQLAYPRSNRAERITWKYDDRRHRIEESRYYEKGESIPEDLLGVTSIRFEYEKKDIITRTFFDSEGAPCVSLFGNAGRRTRYNSDGSLAEESFFDIEGNPCRRTDLYSAKVTYAYDNHGRLVETAFFDPEGNLALNKAKYARKEIKYDDTNVATEIIYFDAVGEIVYHKQLSPRRTQ